MTNYEQWKACMPARGEQQLSDDAGPIDGATLWSRKYGSVETIVSVPVSWPGLIDPEGIPNAIAGRERKRFGRWALDETGLVCLGQDWDIGDDRFEELDWLGHVLGVNWCYDPTDFFDGLQEARRAFCAHLGEDWIDAAVWAEIRAVLAEGALPVYPSSLITGQRIYFPNRMSPAQRDAFAAFLVEQDISGSQ